MKRMGMLLFIVVMVGTYCFAEDVIFKKFMVKDGIENFKLRYGYCNYSEETKTRVSTTRTLPVNIVSFDYIVKRPSDSLLSFGWEFGAGISLRPEKIEFTSNDGEIDYEIKNEYYIAEGLTKLRFHKDVVKRIDLKLDTGIGVYLQHLTLQRTKKHGDNKTDITLSNYERISPVIKICFICQWKVSSKIDLGAYISRKLINKTVFNREATASPITDEEVVIEPSSIGYGVSISIGL